MRQNRRHAADHGGSDGAAQSRVGVAGARGPRVLVLGGSTEGFAVAQALHEAGYEPITSFAGRTETRRAPVGAFRVGGFGGAVGLSAWLAVEDIAMVVDATHPFAARIKANAAAACADVGVPVVHVLRPAWTPGPGDDWRFAPDLASAAELIPATEGPCFLTVGRMKIAHFARRADVSFLIRTVDPPADFDHPRTLIINDRGPFSAKAERALFEEHRVGSLVTANSGGSGAAAKLAVARDLGLPVVIVDRPSPPEGAVVSTPDEAIAAVREMLAGRAA